MLEELRGLRALEIALISGILLFISITMFNLIRALTKAGRSKLIIKPEVIKRNKISTVVLTAIIFAFIGFVVRAILSDSSGSLMQSAFIAFWIAWWMGPLVSTLIKPRICEQGVFLNGRFLKWSKLVDYELRDDYLQVDFNNLLGIAISSKIRFKHNDERIKNVLLEYLDRTGQEDHRRQE